MLAPVNGVWLAALFVGLGLLPGTWIARTCGVPKALWLPTVAAAASLLAFAQFWLFFFDPIHAPALSRLIALASIGGAAVYLAHPERRAWLRDRDIWLPCLLTLSVTAAYQAYLDWPGVAASVRFMFPLPMDDSRMPWLFADRLFYGFHLRGGAQPPLSTLGFITQTSDRPPLQAAVLLATRGLGLLTPSGQLDERSVQTLAMLCQTIWVAALYGLGRVMGLGRWALACGLAGAATSGFFLVQSIYTWPKLYAAWLFLLALALFIHVARTAPPPARAWRTWTVIGGASALALLAHGGPAYSLVALPVLLLRRDARRTCHPRALAAATIAGALLLAPWQTYQRYVDPPGNMLAKMHLAGVWVRDDRSTLQAISDSYSALTLSEWTHNRWENVKEQWLVWKLPDASVPFLAQWQQYYHHLPALDTLIAGLLAFLIWSFRRGRGDKDSWLPTLTGYTLLTWALWICLSFSPGTALIHHASYAMTALLIFCSALWVSRLPRPVAITMLALHVAFFVRYWLLGPTAAPPAAVQWQTLPAVVMTLAFGLFGLLLFALPESKQEGPIAE